MDKRGTFGFEEEFQKHIVAAALQDPTFLTQYSDVLQPNYFDPEYLISIVRIIRELSTRHKKTPDKMSVTEEVKDHCMRYNLPNTDRLFMLGKLDELYRIQVVDIEYIRERVVEFGQRQSVRAAILSTAANINSSPSYNKDLHEKSRTQLEAAFRIGFDGDMGTSLYPNLLNLPERMKRTSTGLDRKVPTMFKTLNENTNGGPGRGEVWTVCGKPGRGKSALMVNLGVAAAKNGISVFHYTIGDLNEDDVSCRYAARLTGLPQLDVIKGTEEYLRKAREVAQYNQHVHIKYFPSGTGTIGHIRSHAARLAAIEGIVPGVIIIDYPEELKRTSDNLYLDGDANYTAINALAADMNVLVWTVSQPKNNWQPKHKHDVLKLEDMAESSRKSHKIDGFISWNVSYEEQQQGLARGWVDKTRRNKSFYVIWFKVDMEKMVISETDPPEDYDEEEQHG